MDDLWERFNSGELLSADSIRMHTDGKKFMTSCRDTLYGGEGITPNIFVPLDTSLTQRKIIRLLTECNISNLVYDYFMDNMQRLSVF